MNVHDHFYGAAHCVECRGRCRLTGDELNLTRLVRYILERAAVDGYCWSFITDALADLLGKQRVTHLRQRAKETVAPHERPRR